MNFVDDQKIEPVAQSLHIAERAGEGRYGNRLFDPTSIAVLAYTFEAGFSKCLKPLCHEHTRRDQAKRPKPGSRHRRNCGAGLPGARRKDDDASPTGALPRSNRRGLVGTEIRAGYRLSALQLRADFILEIGAAPCELAR
jgi:hypothetical protein